MVNLTDRYRPRTLAELAGLDKPRAILTKLAADPYASSWLLVGPPGIGKTTAGLILAETLPAELHHIPSRDCDLEAVRETLRVCAYAPMRGRFHLVLVDEADEMTRAAQIAFLSALDATASVQTAFLADPLQAGGFSPQTIFVFTANATDGLEKRFLSRCRTLEFSSYGIAGEAVDLLARVWAAEAGGKTAPNFARIVKDSSNNLRDALMKLELELMAAWWGNHFEPINSTVEPFEISACIFHAEAVQKAFEAGDTGRLVAHIDLLAKYAAQLQRRARKSNLG